MHNADYQVYIFHIFRKYLNTQILILEINKHQVQIKAFIIKLIQKHHKCVLLYKYKNLLN